MISTRGRRATTRMIGIAVRAPSLKFRRWDPFFPKKRARAMKMEGKERMRTIFWASMVVSMMAFWMTNVLIVLHQRF